MEGMHVFEIYGCPPTTAKSSLPNSLLARKEIYVIIRKANSETNRKYIVQKGKGKLHWEILF